MGTLDEAIREHFDLKRRHGVDPDEVAREERATLASFVGDVDEPVEQAQEPHREASDQPAHPEHDAPVNGGAPARPSVALDNEETVEIDMGAIFADNGAADETGHPPEPDAVHAADSEQRRTTSPARAHIESPLSASIEDGSLVWEDPEPRVRRLSRRPARSGVFDGELPAGRSLP